MTDINKANIVATYHNATLADITDALLKNTNITAGLFLIRFTLHYRRMGLISTPSWRKLAKKYTKYIMADKPPMFELDKEIKYQYKILYEQIYKDWAKENDIILWPERGIDRIRVTISHDNIRAIDDTLFWIDNEVDAMAFKLRWE